MTTPAIMNLIDPVIVNLHYPASFENNDFDKSEHTRYLKVSYLESRSEQENYGVDRVPCILQIDRCVKSGSGNRDLMVQDVLSAFPKNTEFTSADVDIRIDRAPTVGPSFNVNGWHITPISIYYEVYR
jgi:hypothetical protein